MSPSPERPVVAVMVMDTHTVMMTMAAPDPYVHPRTCIPVVIMPMMAMTMAMTHTYRYVRAGVAIPMIVMPVLYAVPVTEVTS
jgi:hypothetical protein